MTTTTVQALITKTGTFNGSSIDVSAITGDWTLEIEVTALVGTVRLGFQDSVDAFTTPLAGPTIALIGTVTNNAPKKFSFNKRDFEDLRCGTGSAVLRLAVLNLTGASASVTYQAFIKF